MYPDVLPDMSMANEIVRSCNLETGSKECHLQLSALAQCLTLASDVEHQPSGHLGHSWPYWEDFADLVLVASLSLGKYGFICC